MKLECKDCKRRHEGCHSDCESYLDFKRERQMINELRDLEHQKNVHTVENVIQIRKRTGYYKKGGKRWKP